MCVKGQEASAWPVIQINVYTDPSWEPKLTGSVCTDQIQPADQFQLSSFFHGQADVGENSQKTLQKSVSLFPFSFLGRLQYFWMEVGAGHSAEGVEEVLWVFFVFFLIF